MKVRWISRIGILFVLAFFLYALTGLQSAEFDDKPGDVPLAAQEAARTMVVPEGFHVSLFAGEPAVKQPISFCIDDRGRLWVAEAYNYPKHGTRAGDRIVILEDTDGNGEFDKRTIFYDQLNYVTGIEVGFGGAWVMSPPYFYFIADRDGDDRPDGKPMVLLDGFGNHANPHNLANGFAWGPDGWLYGTHGRTNWSMLGKPGTPQKDRVRFDGGVYRYHPVRHIWEPFADGTTNPWGIDWDDYGQGFVCNCVNPHLFHVIQGAHYEPWRNRKSSQYAYQRIPSIADHRHFTGIDDVHAGHGSEAELAAGGGHAHCGTMVYLGDNWPDTYRNTVFMNNIHGRRINNDLLKRKGSGYTASHGKDLMLSRDPWYMGVTIQYGPDGSVFASDWSDTGECHSYRNTRRATGRIYKISYGKPAAAKIHVAGLSDSELVELQLHKNDWFVRHARRVLQERAADGQEMNKVYSRLYRMFADQESVPRKLRALWALHATGGLNDEFLIRQLNHQSEYIRAWAIQLLCEDKRPPEAALQVFQQLAQAGESPFVRLHLASALQRLPQQQRWPIAAALVARQEDANDANLPLMLWYAVEPLVEADLDQFVRLASSSKIPLICNHAARRMAQNGSDPKSMEAIVRLLDQSNGRQTAEILSGTLQGLKGRRTVAMPKNWPPVYGKIEQAAPAAVREQALQLALVFDDPQALATLRKQVVNQGLGAAARNKAIQILVAKKVADLAPLLIQLVQERATRSSALRGLAEYNHRDTPTVILTGYAEFDSQARQHAVQTLASRTEWARKLLDAVEVKKVPRSDITAFVARQLLSLEDEQLTARVERLWGRVRETKKEKRELIEKYKSMLTRDQLKRADLASGRAIFQKTCANCHKLFDTGGKIGPEITGAQRTNLDYLLENIIDPSAVVSKDYQMQKFLTESGRIITGLVVAESDQAVTIQTANEKIVVPVDEIDERFLSSLSMMPEGMFKQLNKSEIRNLIAYLSSPKQVALKAGDRHLLESKSGGK